jgi:predicted nucleic acid-binding protein
VKRIVVDASVALAWGFPDESSEDADSVLEALEGCTMWVPALWAIEVTNGIVVGKRRKRLDSSSVRRFLAMLEQLPVLQDHQSIAETAQTVLPLAEQFGLSAYDAAYLELAARHGAPLATLDDALRKAARKAGVEVLLGER